MERAQHRLRDVRVATYEARMELGVQPEHVVADEDLSVAAGTRADSHDGDLEHVSGLLREVGRDLLIVYDKESTYFQLIDRVCREAGILPTILMDLDSIEATKRMIERGLGISFLPHSALRRELAMGTLTQVEILEGHQVTLPTAVMVRRAARYGAIVTAFLDLLGEMYPHERTWRPDAEEAPA